MPIPVQTNPPIQWYSRNGTVYVPNASGVIQVAPADLLDALAAGGTVVPASVYAQYAAVAGNTPLTLTAAQVAGVQDATVNLTAALAGAGTVTTPTAAQIVAAIPNAEPGMQYRLRVINSSSGAFAWTVAAGAGVTLNGTMTIAQNTWRDFYVTLTSLTAVAWQSIGTGTFS